MSRRRPTRARVESDVSEAEDIKPRKASRASTSTTAKTRTKAAKIIIPERYLAQFPIDTESVSTIGNLSNDYDSLTPAYDIYLDLITDAAAFLEESMPPDSSDLLEYRNKLQDAVKLHIDDTLKIDVLKRGLKDLASQVRINQGKNVTNLRSLFEKTHDTHMQKQLSMTARQKYKDSKVFKKFIKNRHNAQNTDESAPLATDFLPREAGDGEESDSEIEGGEIEQNLKDPITMTWLVDPVKTPSCPHAFSKGAINQLLTQNVRTGPGVSCPVRGCKGIIFAHQLVADKSLEKDVERAKAREADAKAKSQGPLLHIDSSDEE